jgi:hypothetical protein
MPVYVWDLSKEAIKMLLDYLFGRRMDANRKKRGHHWLGVKEVVS